MAVSLAKIERQAKTLAAEDRAKLAESLLDSLHTPSADIESVWADEIENRVGAHDRGEAQTYATEDVFAEARLLLR